MTTDQQGLMQRVGSLLLNCIDYSVPPYGTYAAAKSDPVQTGVLHHHNRRRQRGVALWISGV